MLKRMLLLTIVLGVVIGLGLQLTTNGFPGPKVKPNDLVVGCVSKPKKDGTDQIDITFCKDENTVVTYEVKVPLKKGIAPKKKAEGIVTAINNPTGNLHDKMTAAQGQLKTNAVEMLGNGQYKIKSVRLRNRTKQKKTTFTVVKDPTDMEAQTMTLSDYDWHFLELSLEGEITGHCPDSWQLDSTLSFYRLGMQPIEIELYMYDSLEAVIQDITDRLEALGLGEVTNPTALSVRWEFPVRPGTGISLVAGCDDDGVTAEFEIGRL